jgi:phage terminase large subunit-like protein
MKPRRLYKDVHKFQNEVIRRAFEYEVQVESGVQIAGKRIKQAVKRSRALRDKYSYSESAFRVIASIFYHLYIPINDHPQQFIPDNWQAWVLLNLFAIINPKTGKRVHTEGLVYVARKSGKTFFGVGILLAYMTKFGGMQSESFCAATVQKQAKQAMDYCKVIIRNSPALKHRIKPYREELIFDDGHSRHTLEQLSCQQSGKIDGRNPSMCLFDEFHAYTDINMYEDVITGMGARHQPLSLIVSTAGFLTVGYPLHDKIQLAYNILDNKQEDDGTFYAIYELDSESEATGDINILQKANPGLGSTISVERFKAMRDKALLLGTSWTHFLVKNCNIFKSTVDDAFIDDELWVKCCSDTPYNELKGGRAWIGIDLSTRIDLAALTVIVEHPTTKKLHTIPYHYFPDTKENSSKRVRANGVDLSDWIRDGYIVAHKDGIDYEAIYKDILNIYETYDVQMVGYDPHAARELVSLLNSNLEHVLIPVEAIGQSTSVMSVPSKFFEQLVHTRAINLGKNPVFRYCNSNARVKYFQTSSLIRVIKDKQLNPIDSVVSSIISVACYMQTEFDEIKHLIKDSD